MIERPLKIYSDKEDDWEGGKYIKNKKGKKVYIKSKLSKKRLQKHLKVNLKRKKKMIATRVYTRKQTVIDRAGDTTLGSGKAPPLGKDYIYLTTKEKDDNLVKELKKNRDTRQLELGMTETNLDTNLKTNLKLEKQSADMKAEIKNIKDIGRKAIVELENLTSSKAEPKNQVRIKGVSTGRKLKPEKGYSDEQWKKLSGNEKTRIKTENLKNLVKQNKGETEFRLKGETELKEYKPNPPPAGLSRDTTGFNLNPYENMPPKGETDKKKRVISKMKEISNKKKFESKKATFEAMRKVREDRVKDIARHERLFIELKHLTTGRMRTENKGYV